MKIESSWQTWTEQSNEDCELLTEPKRHLEGIPSPLSNIPGYSHCTGRRQVCSLTSGSPGVVTRHSSAAPASSRPGVSTVELTRRPPSTELWTHQIRGGAELRATLTWVWVWVSCWPFFHHDTLWLGRAPRTCYITFYFCYCYCLLLADLTLQPPWHAHHEGNIRAENLDRERRHWK